MMVICCVFDSKAAAFASPMFFQSRGVALRQFMTAANDESTEICKYAEDYSMFFFGTFDEQSGKFDLVDPPENMGLASTMKEKADG